MRLTSFDHPEQPLSLLTQIAGITLPIFLIVAIGFFYSRSVKPDLAGANKLVVDIALPALIFTSLATKSFSPQAALLFAAASTVLMLLSGALAWPLARWSGTTARAFVPCVMFANVGPVGIPLIVLAYGPEGMASAVVLLVLSNILHFTLGSAVMSGRVDWRMVYANPLVWATLLGVLFSQLRLTMPGWVGTPLTLLGQVLVPMMLLSLGARLSTSAISDGRVGLVSALLAVLVRLLACHAVLAFVPLQGIERGALVLFACLPPAVFNYLLADRYRVQPNQVASTVIVGHLASLAVLPLGIWLALG